MGLYSGTMQPVKWSLSSQLVVMVVVLPFVLVEMQDTNSTKTRDEKVLSVFTVVKFPNTVCTSSTSGRNGTCYTTSECASKGGSSSGSCASSFGVCCVFEKSCGAGSVSENCTYFTSSSLTTGSSCTLTICKCDTDVCQLRLDFETFVLNNPVTATATTGGTGDPTFSRVGNCDTDTFGITTPGGKSPPAICGTNTGQHMYVPASDQCNTLNAHIGSGSTATTSAFTIKVTQVKCGNKLAAPNGCTQFMTGSTGTIETYNYNSGGGVLLANQDYSICIRDERTYCSICYWTATTFKMSVPNGIAAIGELGVDTNCGSPGITNYANGGAYDHIVIPGGQCNSPLSAAIPAINVLNDRYCGTALYCLGAIPTDTLNTAATDSTVCSNQKPFKVTVKSDGVEYTNGAANSEGATANNVGFSINYYMRTTCLTRPS